MCFEAAHIASMSHIATLPSRPFAQECHYSGQAFRVSKFYTRPMGLRIRQLREERGLTQLQLAELSNMSRSQLAMIESEARPANTLRLNAIASALDVTPEQLFDSGNDDWRILELLSDMSAEDRVVLVRIAESLAAKGEKA